MAFQAHQPSIQLKYFHWELVYVGTWSETKKKYNDCWDKLCTKGVDIAFTFW
jgi:hypothetical protein